VIKLQVRQAQQPKLEIVVEGNSATIGRTAGCDVVVNQPYVSKRHLRIYKGVVVIDLGSSNGSFIDGQRISEPTLLDGRELRLGDGDAYISVAADDADGPRTAPSPSHATAELEQWRVKCASLEAENRRLAQEAAVKPASNVAPARNESAEQVERLEREVRALRERLAAAENSTPRPAGASGELLIKLQTENSGLKRRLTELEGRTPPMATPVPSESSPAKLLQEIVELRAGNAALRAQLANAVGSRPVPVPAVAPASFVANARASNVRALLAELAAQDVDGRAALLDASPEEFVVLEQFRLMRHVERIVTRLAGDFIQLYHANTMLPDVGGNLRELIARVVDPSNPAEARRELLAYSTELTRWLVAALGAHRRAAARFAERLKADLSESALTANAPIPAFKRLAGQGEAELWRRTGVYLRELTPDMLEDRLEKLAREAAVELLGERGDKQA
jgi:hypothetical protein